MLIIWKAMEEKFVLILEGYYLFKLNDGILKIVDHYVASTYPGDIKLYKIEDNKILLKAEGYAVDDKKIELTF